MDREAVHISTVEPNNLASQGEVVAAALQELTLQGQQRLSERWRLRLLSLTILALFAGLGLLQQVGMMILMALGIVRIFAIAVSCFLYIFFSRRDLVHLGTDRDGRGDERSGSQPTSQQTWHHALVIPTYLESPQTTRAVLHSLAEQQCGMSKRTLVVVSFEEASPGLLSVQTRLNEFEEHFEARNTNPCSNICTVCMPTRAAHDMHYRMLHIPIGSDIYDAPARHHWRDSRTRRKLSPRVCMLDRAPCPVTESD